VDMPRPSQALQDSPREAVCAWGRGARGGGPQQHAGSATAVPSPAAGAPPPPSRPSEDPADPWPKGHHERQKVEGVAPDCSNQCSLMVKGSQRPHTVPAIMAHTEVHHLPSTHLGPPPEEGLSHARPSTTVMTIDMYTTERLRHTSASHASNHPWDRIPMLPSTRAETPERILRREPGFFNPFYNTGERSCPMFAWLDEVWALR
jgi:hypothetical protein